MALFSGIECDMECMEMGEKIIELEEVLRLYDAAAENFIAKVESGRARSMETYNDLKQALAKSKEVVLYERY